MNKHKFLFLILLASLGTGCNPFQKERPNLYRTFKCQQQIPEFTLTEKSNPTDSDLDLLCKCIWNGLGEFQAESKKAVSSSLRPSDAFLRKFGSLISSCKTSDY